MFLATVLVIMVLLVQDTYFETYEVFRRLELNFSWDSEWAKLLKSTEAYDLGMPVILEDMDGQKRTLRSEGQGLVGI